MTTSGSSYPTFGSLERQQQQLHSFDFIVPPLPSSAFITSIDDGDDDPDHKPIAATYTIGAEPPLDFARTTWWDNLLGLYSHSRESS